VRLQPTGAGETCRRILATLPHWFGIAESNENYKKVADRTPTLIASLQGEDVGLLVLVHHSPQAAEVFLMAVVPWLHRQGIGQLLLARAEEQLSGEGVEFLQVKTLSPSKADAGYAKTRAFYQACGFKVLEEFPLLWDANNPAVQLIKAL
jgi:GNAT superfamily N-acetyltransferase